MRIKPLDGVSLKLLRMTVSVLVGSLTKILNLSIGTGKFAPPSGKGEELHLSSLVTDRMRTL